MERKHDPRIARAYWEGSTFWIDLAPGFVFESSGVHSVCAFTKQERGEAFARMKRDVVPCDCATCRVLSRPAAHRQAS